MNWIITILYKVDLNAFGKIENLHVLKSVSYTPHYLQAPLGGGGRSGALSVTLRAALKVVSCPTRHQRNIA